MTGSRDGWIDLIKIFACVLVVLGHFFQSMVSSSIMDRGAIFEWFEKTVYYFHVPLFFIASGFIYQRYTKTENFVQYRHNVLKKLISLGIPYFAFSAVTWVMKKAFQSSVNNAPEGLFRSLFLSPISPYWYLYALFFMFLLIPTFKNKTTACLITAISFAAKFASVMSFESGIYAIDILFKHAVWFVLGMLVCTLRVHDMAKGKKCALTATVLCAVFVGASVPMYVYKITDGTLEFLMGVLGCAACVIASLGYSGRECVTISRISDRYTMPVYLMHTIFAAALRALLIKAGIDGAAIHIAAGLVISFAGPVVATMIMTKCAPMDIVIRPGKYLRLKKPEKTTGEI